MNHVGEEGPDLVPARMLNEFVYCPRLAYLEWVQGEWADNSDTVEGRWAHRRVDEGAGQLPGPGESDARDLAVRAVTLAAPGEGLIARMDLVEADAREGIAIPVDFKRGKPPNNPEQAWEPERIQLCAQGLILRENGWRSEGGLLYYSASKQRVEVPFTEELVARTREHVQSLRRTFQSSIMPPPLVNSPKCPRCSLAPICLPDEVNLLRGTTEELPRRRLIPPRDDALPLYIQQQGLSVGISGEVLEIREQGKKIGEARLIDTSQLCLMGNVQVSTQALRTLTDHGIPVCYFSSGGWFSAITTGMSHKNVELRRHQFRAAFDPDRSLALARRFVFAKIRNCRTLLRRNHRSPPPDLLEELNRLASATRRAASLEALLGIEGLAGRLYFSHFAGMLKQTGSAGDLAFRFEDRNRRPPTDPINAMLSFVYSLLTKDLAVVTLATGFDPFQGFYHQPRYGRPALALDLMEEFRPLVADSAVLWAVNNGVITPADFFSVGPAVALKPAARKALLNAYERRLDEPITHPVFGYRVTYRRVLHIQARLLARHLAGEIPDFPAFLTR